MSGIHDGLNLSAANVVPAFDDDICLDPDFIPSYIQSKDHRGRPIYRNSYAYDFYVHGSKDLLITENKGNKTLPVYALAWPKNANSHKNLKNFFSWHQRSLVHFERVQRKLFFGVIGEIREKIV